VRRTVPELLSDRDPLVVERVGRPADCRLRAFVVDVPRREVLQRPGVHHDQRRVDDRSGIHQRAGERIAAVLDRIERAPKHAERVRCAPSRQDPGW
jgi:hypothetical protein